MNAALPALPDHRLAERFEALRNELLQHGAGHVSTMRAYRFAILPYPPAAEFDLRRHVQSLTLDLEKTHGWEVCRIDLAALMMARLRNSEPGFLERAIASERRLAARDPGRALNQLQERLGRLLDGPDGLVADVANAIAAFNQRRQGPEERTLVWLERCGALYPFVRVSGLLRHLDGRTHHLPLVLLYPGVQRGPQALSFMGRLEADRDYRPRIIGAEITP